VEVIVPKMLVGTGTAFTCWVAELDPVKLASPA
jgi:hypothetical protein